jgi:hypothetical protein
MNTFTLQRKILPDGCWVPDVADVVAEAKRLAKTTAQGRYEGRTRFSVLADEEWTYTNRADVLTRYLEAVRVGARIRVFRNADGGATIDCNA